MKKQFLAFIAIFTFIAIPLIAATGVPELDNLKSKYNSVLERIKSNSLAKRLHAPQNHIAAMRKMEKEYQLAGDLQNLLAVRNERKRFIGDPRPDAIEVVSSPQKLRILQQSYIDNYKAINKKRESDIQRIKEQYIARLQILQKTLTKKGKIESAMAVMKEIEATKSGNNNEDTIASDPLADDVTSEDFVPASTPKENLSIKSLRKLLHGKVTRWNSYNHEITLEYDFTDQEQMKDWKDGKIDEFSNILNCKQKIAWLKVQMSKIKRVECDIYLDNPSLSSGLVIGGSLTLTIDSDRTINGKIYQSSEEHPILRAANIEKTFNNAYHSVLSFNDKSVSWIINKDRVRHGTLVENIKYPTFIGFGSSYSTSSYGNIKITGTLSKKEIARLKSRL